MSIMCSSLHTCLEYMCKVRCGQSMMSSVRVHYFNKTTKNLFHDQSNAQLVILMAAISVGVILVYILAVLVTGTEGEGSLQATDLMLDIAFGRTLLWSSSELPRTVGFHPTFHNFTIVKLNSNSSVELINSDAKGLHISPYGLLESEIIITGSVILWSYSGGPERSDQAERLMSVGFSDAINFKFDHITVITYVNITIAQVTTHQTK